VCGGASLPTSGEWQARCQAGSLKRGTYRHQLADPLADYLSNKVRFGAGLVLIGASVLKGTYRPQTPVFISLPE
jgi:hypothetical protein